MTPSRDRSAVVSALVAMMLWSGAATAGTSPLAYFVGPGLGIAIPDDDPAGVSSTISVPDSGTITRMAVLVSMDHTFVGDLIWTLTSPDGTTAILGNRPGEPDVGAFGDSSNLSTDYAIIFGDMSPFAAESLGGGSCGDTDSIIGLDCPRWVAPDDSLGGTFAGSDIFGDWTLTISDNAGADLGVLDGWMVAFEINGGEVVVPVPAAFWLLLSGTVGLLRFRRKG